MTPKRSEPASKADYLDQARRALRQGHHDEASAAALVQIADQLTELRWLMAAADDLGDEIKPARGRDTLDDDGEVS
jgi:hypothetical protein